MHPIEIKNLVKYYGKLCAVKDLSFSLNQGEIFGLLGPNGAGKTTTISIITTLEKATSGEVFVFGKNILKHPKEIKSSLGIVPQELISHGFFNVEEVLHFHSGYYGISNNKDWIEFLLDKLQLSQERKKLATQLSGGMKRRLLIAKALLHKPKLLILDEPTAGVDVDLRTTLWEFIRELNKQGTTILLTTHYLEEAEELCDRVGIIHLGKLLKLDQTQKLIQDFTCRRITLIFKSPIEPIKVSYLLKQDKNVVTLKVPRAMDLSELFKDTKVDPNNLKDIQIEEGTLQEAFQEIIGNTHA